MIVSILFLSIILIILTGIPVGIGLGVVGLGFSLIFEGQSAFISLPQTIFLRITHFY